MPPALGSFFWRWRFIEHSNFNQFAKKKPQAFTHCGFRVRKLIVYERAPAPVRKAKDMPGVT